MKRIFAVILTLIVLFSLAGCDLRHPRGQSISPHPSHSSILDYIDAGDISESLVEEDERLYLILPISKTKVRVSDSHWQYLDDIDLDLLKAAEEKISKEVSRYPDTDAYFHLRLDEGQMYLAAEYIVDIEPVYPTLGPDDTVPEDDPVSGCGIDHEHKIISERITK